MVKLTVSFLSLPINSKSVEINRGSHEPAKDKIKMTRRKVYKFFLLQISCIADGARPAAAFSWTLGEDRFEGRVEDQEAVRHQDGTVRQVQVLHYEADPAHNGKAISCIVDHKGFSRQDIEMNKNMATVDLDIQFQPVAADKPQSFYNLQVGEKKEILISFRAHPRPTQVFWTMYDKSQVMEGAESLNKRYTADVLQDGPNDGMFTARLTVAEVMEEDAGSNNELSVTNELGTTKYPFTLSLGDRPAAGEITTLPDFIIYP